MISPTLALEHGNSKALEIRAIALQMTVDNLRRAITHEEERMGSIYKNLVKRNWLKEPKRLQVYRQVLEGKIQSSKEPYNPDRVDYC